MSRACSSSASGLFSANILRFSFICSMLDAPESTTVTPGTLCRKRYAHSTGGMPPSSPAAFSGRFASSPPRSGSITQMGRPRRCIISAFSFAFWKVQST